MGLSRPELWGLRILEIVMENKGGVTIPRWAFGLAAAVVALLVVLVIVLIPRGKDSNPVAAGSSNNEQSQPASSSTAEPSISALAASRSPLARNFLRIFLLTTPGSR